MWVITNLSGVEVGGLPTRSESLSAVVRSGALAVIRRCTLVSGSLYGERVLAYHMPEERSIDINTSYEMKVAQLLYADRLRSKLK